MKKPIWIFTSYAWQGNPKALFLYMECYHSDMNCIWVSDNAKQADALCQIGINAVDAGSSKAKTLLENCAVYVTENFREAYPENLNPDVTVLNLWHGVGLKPVEIGVGATSDFSTRIAKKYIRYFEFYRNNHLFLATSAQMIKRFSPEMKLVDDQIIKGPYPRNVAYLDADLRTFDFEAVTGKEPNSFNRIALFAPTWRRHNVSDSFRGLMPNLPSMAETLSKTNTLLIIKVHPFMKNDRTFLEAEKKYEGHANIIFWPDLYDIYEVFSLINLAIIDYSSIFYDLMAAGVENFVRYVPDYDTHVVNEGFTDDYWDMTTGAIATDHDALVKILQEPQQAKEDHQKILDYFYGYLAADSFDRAPRSGRQADLDAIIAATQARPPITSILPKLYSFDVFDTLVRRKTLSPISVFYRVQELIGRDPQRLPTYLIENYIEVRRSSERDVRSAKLHTKFERRSDTLEVTFEEIFERMGRVFSLTKKQINRLMKLELQIEASVIEANPQNLDRLKQLVADGEKVILISDMYLSSKEIRTLIGGVDPILKKLPLYVSSEVGHKKDSGKLFTHIFFDLDYEYSKWVHYGDNAKADGDEPRKLHIEGVTHQIDAFNAIEASYVVNSRNLDTYQASTLMQRYRWASLDTTKMVFNDKKYFAYAFLGPALVCYINWTIKDAIKRKYKTLYFITRDGILLQEIADTIIKARGLPLKTKLIYGSRKAWRIPRTDDEITDNFTPILGTLGGVRTFKEFVKVSTLTADELLGFVPDLVSFKDEDFTSASVRQAASTMLLDAEAYLSRMRETQQARYEDCLEYLKTEINLGERFGVVEFWGRGVTQGRMTKYLNDIKGKPVDNPFYYVRSIWDDTDRSIRHRFSELPFDFSFMEPILASVRQTTVSGYEKIGKKVEPVYQTQENDNYEDFIGGMVDFAKDYCAAGFVDEDKLDRTLAITAYKYLRSNPSDHFICNIYGPLRDSHGIFAEFRAYAPALSLAQVSGKSGTPIQNFTSSVPISLARSTDAVRGAYNELFPKNPMPKKCVSTFPANPLSRYARIAKGDVIVTRQTVSVYGCVSFSKNSLRQRKIPEGIILNVRDVVWTSGAIPRILTDHGFVTAHNNFVSTLDLIVLRRPKIAVQESPDANVKSTKTTLIPNIAIKLLEVTGVDERKIFAQTHAGAVTLTKTDFVVVRPDIDDFCSEVHSGVMALKPLKFYKSMALIEENSIPNVRLSAQEWVKVDEVCWTNKGTPVLKTAAGHISARRDCVQPARKGIANYILQPKNPLKTIVKLAVYSSPDFTETTKSKETLPIGTLLDDFEISWSDKGTPRIKLCTLGEPLKTGSTDQPQARYVSASLSRLRVVSRDIAKFFHEQAAMLLLLRPLKVYTSTDFSDDTVSTQRISAGQFIKPKGVGWSSNGTPRFQLNDGFVSANRDLSRIVCRNIENYIFLPGYSLQTSQKLAIYEDKEFSKKTNATVPANTRIRVGEIAWSDKGTPRICVEGGFISAKIDYFASVKNDADLSL